MKFKSDIEVQAGMKDSAGLNGAVGDVLSSNGAGVSWIPNPRIAERVQHEVIAGVAINKGQAVYITGASAGDMIAGKASNTFEATSTHTLGIIDDTVAVGGIAKVIQFGSLAGLNTIGSALGDPVWLGVDGNLIYGLANKPYAPAHLVFIGIVTRVNANSGKIFINVQNGFLLSEIQNVDIITDVPINGDILGYDGTLWVNKTIAEWLGYTPVPTTRTITINGTTQDLSANQIWTVASGITIGTANGLSLSGQVLSLGTANPLNTGALTAQDWATFNTKQEALNGTGFVKVVGTTVSYDNSVYVPTSRTITINGVTQDLSANTIYNVSVNAGGGSSVSYYLNGSIPSSIAGYQQMDNAAAIGGGTDFALIGNGLIAQFLTDIGNPNRIEIPGGTWNFEMWFQSSTSGGNQKFYVELLKYNGSTFTSIASSALNPEAITGGTTVDLYLTSLAVPTTPLLVTDRLAIRVYIIDSSESRTVTLHTEDSNLCEIITTFSGGVSALNGLTENTQFFAVGTAGTDFNITSAIATHTFNLPTASATNRGALSSANWTTFNSKANASGTVNRIPKFTAISTIGDSQIFDNGTNLGVGTVVPNYRFSVIGAGPVEAGIVSNRFIAVRKENNALAGYLALLGGDNGDNAKIVGYNASSVQTFEINASATATYFNSGNFLIGTTTDAGFKLDVVGTCRVSGAATFLSSVTATGFFQSSDIRLKNVISHDSDVITYKWKDGRDNKIHTGYSAQEVQKIMPDAVNEDAEGILSVNYIEVFVKKIQDLENRIKQLEK